MDKPDVDMIEGISRAILIEHKATSHKPGIGGNLGTALSPCSGPGLALAT